MIFRFLILGLICLMFSCSDDSSFVEHGTIQLRNIEPCASCDSIQYRLMEADMEDGCCQYQIIAKSADACGYIILLGQDTLGIMEGTYYQNVFSVCDRSRLSIQGIDSDGLSIRNCVVEDIVCSECDCQEVNLSIVDKDKKSGCCVFDVKASSIFTSAPNCKFELEVEGMRYDLGFVSVQKEVLVCSTDSPVRIYGNGVLCREELLNCNSSKDCCEGLEYSIENIESSGQNCCTYTLNLTNDTDCDQFLYSPSNQIKGSVKSGQSSSIKVVACPEIGTDNDYKIGPTLNEICQRFELSPTCSDDCCSGIRGQFELAGIDSRGCCVYRYKVSNDSDCTQFMYDEQGFKIAIAPGEVISGELQACTSSGLSRTIFIGSDTNANNACLVETLFAVC